MVYFSSTSWELLKPVSWDDPWFPDFTAWFPPLISVKCILLQCPKEGAWEVTFFLRPCSHTLAGRSVFFQWHLLEPSILLCLPKTWRIGMCLTLYRRHDPPSFLWKYSWRHSYLTLGTWHALYSKIRQEIISTVLHVPSIFSLSKHLENSAYTMCPGLCSVLGLVLIRDA